MATLSAISGNTSLMYQIAAKGLAADSSTVNYAKLLSGTSKTNKTSAANDIWSLSSPAATYTKSSTSSLYSGASSSDFLSSLAENKSSLNDVLSSYNMASKAFDTEYKTIISDLKQSSATMAATNFNVTGSNDKETADNVATALKNVSNFVNDYNEAVSLFSDYSGLSKRLSNVSSMFSDNSARASGLAAIGININAENGKLSVDTEKLTAAMTDTPAKVEYQLGAYGLSGKTQSKIDVANSQKNQLFPTITEMAGASYTTSQALYTGNALTAMNKYSAIGNFMDLYF